MLCYYIINILTLEVFMENKKNNILTYSIMNCFFLTGGIQVMLHSFSKLLGLNILDNIDTYIFDPNKYLGEQLFCFWVVYGLLLMIIFFFSFFKTNNKVCFKIDEKNSLLTYSLFTLSLLTLIPFIICLIYYLLPFDALNLKRLILFSDGALSFYLKIWIITLPAALFLKNR